VAIVEGVMGLFDSRDGASEDGSTAQVRSTNPNTGLTASSRRISWAYSTPSYNFACTFISLCLQIAKWLGAPVVLVLDCWAMARSVAAVVKGMAEFDPGQLVDL
jgi:cobyrinic acid a,c-diamide synthase